MTAKQYLRKLWYFHRTILTKQKQIDELRLLAESTGAIRYDKDRVVVSLPQAAGYEDKVAVLVDMEHKLLEDIVELTKMINVGLDMINSLEDPMEQLILIMRYVTHMRWEDIAQELGCSVDHVYYKHRRALKKIPKLQ